MKNLFFLLILLLLSLNVDAHDGGHGTPTKLWQFSNSNHNLKANFIENVEGRVYLRNENNKILAYNLSEFTKQEQQYIQYKVNWIANKNTTKTVHKLISNKIAIILPYLGVAIVLLSIFNYQNNKTFTILAFSFLGIAFLISGCASNNSSSRGRIAANNVNVLQSIFGVFDKVNTRYDDNYFYIESDGIPEHEMMTGITNWQQQVPIKQNYTGENAWSIPLQPELADRSLSTKDNFMKGAIAISANGIPIFNPLNNRGEDANAIGELDQWGGHCGRADDYHYHLPPTHLQSKVGKDKPIAYALDGFPVYGITTKPLDDNLGRFSSDSTYQYHTIQEYPYLIAAMKGKVKIDPRTRAPENEIIPQAKSKGVRPDLRPLKGAKITDFQHIGPNEFRLEYKIDSLTYHINYGWDNKEHYYFEFVDPDGSSKNETYERR